MSNLDPFEELRQILDANAPKDMPSQTDSKVDRVYLDTRTPADVFYLDDIRRNDTEREGISHLFHLDRPVELEAEDEAPIENVLEFPSPEDRSALIADALAYEAGAHLPSAHQQPPLPPPLAPAFHADPAPQIPSPPLEQVVATDHLNAPRKFWQRKPKELNSKEKLKLAINAARTCPNCGATGRIEFNDRSSTTLHSSCPECANMWQSVYELPPEA